MGLSLSEIEEKAQELLAAVLAEDHASRAEHTYRKLRCLREVSQIMAVGDERIVQEATLQIKQEALQAMQPHVDVPPEPGHVLKPAADRLHELISYGVQMEASNRTVEYPCPDAADAYQDMHSKLAEILKEGGI